jgi:hypothetical protein
VGDDARCVHNWAAGASPCSCWYSAFGQHSVCVCVCVCVCVAAGVFAARRRLDDFRPSDIQSASRHPSIQPWQGPPSSGERRIERNSSKHRKTTMSATMAPMANAQTEQMVVQQFQEKRQHLSAMAGKISELRGEIQEHEMVLKTLEKMDRDRKCFRLIDQVGSACAHAWERCCRVPTSHAP